MEANDHPRSRRMHTKPGLHRVKGDMHPPYKSAEYPGTGLLCSSSSSPSSGSPACSSSSPFASATPCLQYAVLLVCVCHMFLVSCISAVFLSRGWFIAVCIYVCFFWFTSMFGRPVQSCLGYLSMVANWKLPSKEWYEIAQALAASDWTNCFVFFCTCNTSC